MIDATGYRTDNDPECPIASYSIHQSFDGGATYVPWTSNALTIEFTPNNIKVNRDTPGSYQIYVKTQTVTNHATKSINTHDLLTIKICGNEVVSTTYAVSGILPTYLKFVYNGKSTLMADLSLVFTNTDPIDCPIVQYDIMLNPSDLYTGTEFTIDGTFPTQALSITPIKNFNDYFYIRAITASGVTYAQNFFITVCGAEVVELKTPVLYVYHRGDGYLNLTTESFKDLIYSSDPDKCDVILWELANSSGVVDHSLMHMNFYTKIFNVITTYANHKWYYLTATTLG